MSLFELPVSRGARMARVVAVLLLDLVLAGAGIAMILSYLGDRAEARARSAEPKKTEVAPASPAGEVDVLEPDPVDAEEVKREPSKPARKIAARPQRRAPADDGDRPSATSDPGVALPDPDPDPGPEPHPGGGAGGDTDMDTDMGTGTDTNRDPDVGAGSGADDPDPDPEPGGAGDGDGTIEPEPSDDSRVEFSAARVRRVVDRHRVQLQKCYQRATKSASPSKPLAGRVDIQFVIMPDGTATNVRPVANTTGSDQLADCVKGLIEGWEFPSPGAEEIAFVWPFVFKAP